MFIGGGGGVLVDKSTVKGHLQCLTCFLYLADTDETR